MCRTTMRVGDDSGKVLAGHKWLHLKFVPSLRRIANCRGYTGEDCGKDQGRRECCKQKEGD